MTKVSRAPSPTLCPVPAVMVSCGETGVNANIITLAWVGTVCSDPPMVGISIRPNRHSYSIIKESGEFVINIPSSTRASEVSYCGTVSGRDTDKFKDCGFSPMPSNKIEVPVIAQCPINLECRVTQVLSLGSHDLFLAEIVHVQVDAPILTEGRVDPKKADLLAFAFGKYWQLGSMITPRSIK